MQHSEMLLLLEQLDAPAFLEKDDAVVYGNSAFHALQIADGTPLKAFLGFTPTCLTGSPSDEFPCAVAGVRYTAKRMAMQEGTLYLLSSQEATVPTRALAHSAKSLRRALQQMYSAMDLLDRQLPAQNDGIDGTMSSLLQGIYRLERVADNLEYLQRLQTDEYELKCERGDLTAYLTGLFDKAEFLLRTAGIQLIRRLPEQPFVGTVDRKLLSLAIWNLLANAAANADGETVRVSAERVQRTKLRLKITDSGSGIAPASQPNLMQRYRESMESAVGQSGIGIGLSLVQTIARLHNGSMALSMEAGGATTAAMVIDTDLPESTRLYSDILLESRSLDEGLVGLAEVLPRTAFDRRDALS